MSVREEEAKKIIVFVCTGNTCRSPIAETIFRFELNRRRIENAEVFSAGIAAKGDGLENINLKSVAVLSENGFSVANFHARRLDEEIYRTAHAIICMTDEQRDFLMEAMWKALRGAGDEEIENNVWSFSDICGYEIPDPFGKDMEAYRAAYRQINAAMPHLFKKFFPKETAVLEAFKQAEIPADTRSQMGILQEEKPIAVPEPKEPPKRKRGRPRKNPEGTTSQRSPSASASTRKKSSPRTKKADVSAEHALEKSTEEKVELTEKTNG